VQILTSILYILTVTGLLFLLIFFVLYLSASIISAFSAVPFVGSRERKIRSILAQVNPAKGARFYDLGSGDGRIVFLAAEKFGLHATGIEFNPLLIMYCRIKSHIKRISHAHFLQGNILNHSYKRADIIYIFLFPGLIEKLGPKLLSECKPGTVIISHGFKVHDMKKNLFKTVDDSPFSTYFYKI
jgi:SAM-dependent methyltransferase